MYFTHCFTFTGSECVKRENNVFINLGILGRKIEFSLSFSSLKNILILNNTY